jgi:amino acid transporter
MAETSAPLRVRTDREARIRLDDLTMGRRTGSKREADRRLTGTDSTSLTLSIISILTGLMGLFGQGLQAGGPAVMIWTWVAFGIPIWCVARSMGEICSAFPTLGGPFYWTYRLATRHKRPASWLVAWLNFTGDLAGTAFAAFSAALFIGALANVELGFAATLGQVLAISFGIMMLAGALNSFAVGVVGWLNRASLAVHLLGALTIAGALLAFAPHLQSPHFVFTTFVNKTGWHSPLYVIALGAIVPLLTFTGFDANGHKADETIGASRTAPRAMTRSVELSWVFGFILLLGLCFAIQDLNKELAGSYSIVPAQIMVDALPGSLAITLIIWVIVGQLMCVMSCVDAGSRMVLGAARENALFANKFFHHLTPNTKVPLRGVWLMALGSFVFCVPGSFGLPWFYGVTAYAAIALFLVYVIPTFLRLIHADRFEPGDLKLKHPFLVGWTAVGSVVIASIAASLPLARDYMHFSTMNWALPGVLLLVALVLIGYRIWGGKYLGPQQHITTEELAALEADL